MQDPDTMSYNKGYDMDFDGYNKETGCIAFPEREWADWYDYFVGREPERFYAYIVRESDGEFLGEVNIHKNEDSYWYDMGIILEAKYRAKGYSSEALWLLLQHAFEDMNAEAVHNDFEDKRASAIKAHLSVGFTQYRSEKGIIELLITKEQYFRQKAVRRMTAAIGEILADNQPSIYLYGSSVLNDFRPGWSDIDILVLTQKSILTNQAEELVALRQKLHKAEPDNPYYRLFEGGMLTLSAFIANGPDCVVYWGTSGQRITDHYRLDSFSLSEIMHMGRLLCGKDIRSCLKAPKYADFYRDVKKHYETIRRYAKTTGRSFYTFGWLLDIARGLYTLRYGAVASKTAAGMWALDNGLCPVQRALETALKVRKNPQDYINDEPMLDYAENLDSDIQRFADVLEKELKLRENI